MPSARSLKRFGSKEQLRDFLGDLIHALRSHIPCVVFLFNSGNLQLFRLFSAKTFLNELFGEEPLLKALAEFLAKEHIYSTSEPVIENNEAVSEEEKDDAKRVQASFGALEISKVPIQVSSFALFEAHVQNIGDSRSDGIFNAASARFVF
ncbi:hypothetical protein OSTOST_03189 [Ostertagia ostertagi]